MRRRDNFIDLNAETKDMAQDKDQNDSHQNSCRFFFTILEMFLLALEDTRNPGLSTTIIATVVHTAKTE